MFLNGYSPESINALVPGGWSIAVEVNFYILFPLLLSVVRNLRRSLALVLLTLILSQIARKAFSLIFAGAFIPEQGYILQNFIFMNFFNQAPVFAIGISTYFILSNSKLSRPSAILSATVLFGTMILALLYPGGTIQFVNGHLVVAAALFAMAAVALHSFPIKPLVNKPLEFIGKISFSLYLVHFAILFYLEKLGVKAMFQQGNLSSLAYFLLVLAIGCILAAVFHLYVERPGVLLGAKLIRSLEERNSSPRSDA